MEYLRVYATASWSQWFDKKPKLSMLLKCFDLDRNQESTKQVAPVSVFRARNQDEELQAVAAFFQTAPGTVEKRYAICITEKDCGEAGIEIDFTHGQTGVHFVDARHADLKGTLDNFIQLANVITRRIWEGDNRYRIYSKHTILGEVAILSRLADGIDDGAIQGCNEVLAKSADLHRFPDGRDVVKLIGKMDDKKKEVLITATRKLQINAGNRSLLHTLRDRFLKLLLRR